MPTVKSPARTKRDSKRGETAFEKKSEIVRVDGKKELCAIDTKRILLSVENTTQMINVLKRYSPTKLNKDGLAQVFLFIYLDGQRIRFTTDVFLKPNEWDKDKSHELPGKSKYWSAPATQFDQNLREENN